MTLLALLLAALSFAAPNKKLTPGATDPRVTQATIQETICKPGFTATVRNTSLATKKLVFERYGIAWADHALYEVDHLVSLELGGADVVTNLWPEPYNGALGARQKDVVETTLKREVCAGKRTLKDAQARIKNWVPEYHRITGK
jgi:hypothetical protein